MCGRFIIISTPSGIVAKFLLMDFSFYTRYNIAPTQDIHGIIYDSELGRRIAHKYAWGLVPHWAKDKTNAGRMINARAETLSEKASFRAAFKHRRCLIPASGFYEWKTEGGKKQPYLIRLKDEEIFAFAGIYEHWEKDGESLDTAAIITCEPNEFMSLIHTRMPVILNPDNYDEWLAPDNTDIASLSRLFVPCKSSRMNAHRVSNAVSNPRNEGPELIEELMEKVDESGSLISNGDL